MTGPVYRPKFVPQYNDPTTTLDWFNCTMASGAMGLDFDTLGGVRVLGGQLRAVSGDYSGGSGLGSPGLTRAWAHYGQTLHILTGQGWQSVVDALHQYRGVILQGMYGALPKQYRSPFNSPTFDGPHAMYLNPEQNVDGDVLTGDPLNKDFIWIPQSALRSFAQALGVHEGFSSSYIFAGTSDAHAPAIPHDWHLFIAKGTKVIQTATIVGGVVVRWTNVPWSGSASSAPCERPVTRRTILGATTQTALVTSGAFSGEHVHLSSGVSAS